MKPSQSGLKYPIFNEVCICPSKKLQIFYLHTPLDFEAKYSTLNSISLYSQAWKEGDLWPPVQSDSEEEEEAEEEDVEEEEEEEEAEDQATEEEAEEEEEDDDEEEDEEDREEEGNRAKRMKA